MVLGVFSGRTVVDLIRMLPKPRKAEPEVLMWTPKV